MFASPTAIMRSNNPKAYYKKRVTVEDVVNSRMICKPLHLLDCCVETDNANAIIVTTAERAKDLKHPLVRIRGVVGRCSKPRVDMHYQAGPISTVAGHYAKDILWPNSGVGPEDVDLTGSYDAFTFTTMLQLEDYGFCKKGEGGHYVSDGTIMLGGKRPNNTSGGHLCEGYTHGIAMVIENVRQLRHDADDSCPIGPDGRRQHTYDYREGGCRQVKNAEVSANLGWAMPGTGSAMVMRRGRANDIRAQYLGMPLEINDLDHENLNYFAYCAKHDFRLQRCASCKLLRYPPTTACPWCSELISEWVSVEGSRHRAFLHRSPSCHSTCFQAVHAVSRIAGRAGHPERHADQGRGAPRDRQSGAAGRGARAEGRSRAGRHRHPGAHGFHRCRAGAGAAAMDD